MRIAIVDDDPSVREMVTLQFELEGHDVASACDGAAGWALVQEQQPDLVVLDVMMPELNGWEVLERIRGSASPPPVLMLTARDMPQDRQRAHELGASAVLAKPHDGQLLMDTAHALLAARAAQ